MAHRGKSRSAWIAESVQARMEGSKPPAIPDEWRYIGEPVDGMLIAYTVAPLVNGLLSPVGNSTMRAAVRLTDSVNGKFGVIVRLSIPGQSMPRLESGKVVKSRAFKRRKDARAYAEKLWHFYRAREQARAERQKAVARRRIKRATERKAKVTARRGSAALRLRHAEAMQKKAVTRAKRAETLLRKWTKEVRKLRNLIERELKADAQRPDAWTEPEHVEPIRRS